MRTGKLLIDFKSRIGSSCCNTCEGKKTRSPFFRHFLIGLNITFLPIQDRRSWFPQLSIFEPKDHTTRLTDELAMMNRCGIKAGIRSQFGDTFLFSEWCRSAKLCQEHSSRSGASRRMETRYCCTGVQLGSGSNSVIAAAVCAVSVPKSFCSRSLS